MGVLVRLPDGDLTDGVERAQTTGSITVSPDGNDVYVASNTSLHGRGVDEEAWVTGFPVASVVTPAQPATPVFSAPTAPGLSVQLQADDGPPVAMTMSPDGTRLVLATAQAIASPAAIGTVLDVLPVTSSAPGTITAPAIDGTSCVAGATCATDGNSCLSGATCANSTVSPPLQSLPLDIGVPESAEALALTPDQSPAASFTDQAEPAGSASTFDATGSKVQFGTITAYDWNFGDGGTAAGPTATHAFGLPGNYSVTLCEVDSAGVTDGPPGLDPLTGTALNC